jgi:hypothetical protein
MKRLILSGSYGLGFRRANLAEVIVQFIFDFTWGELPSPQQLATYLDARSDSHGRGEHWSDFVDKRRLNDDRLDLSLLEFCEPYDEVDLWFDPRPANQLILIWLLDFFRPYPELLSKIRVRLLDFDLLYEDNEKVFLKGKIPAAPVGQARREIASLSWQAYRATTPEACFEFLKHDSSDLPLLRPALIDLLEELPGPTGLGASELRMLNMLGAGYIRTSVLFYHRGLRQTRVFGEWQLGYLLDGLAHGPKPVVAGLDDEIRTLSLTNYRDRETAYKRSRLTTTDFGRAVLRHEEDFSRHNPIDRWWGGTHLTSDRMWRWQPTLIGP